MKSQPPSEGRGRRFEFCRVHQKTPLFSALPVEDARRILQKHAGTDGDSRAAAVQSPYRPRICPVTGKRAIAWIAETHRHLPKLQGALFAVGVEEGGRLMAVGTAGNPPRVWQGTGRFVITRVAAESVAVAADEHARPYCTMIYGALCRAGKALGYREAWTYTLPEEPGTSLRAAGFEDMGMTRAEEWDRPSGPRSKAVRAEAKRRWRRVL